MNKGKSSSADSDASGAGNSAAAQAAPPAEIFGHSIKQKRGHLTYEALIEAGFRLLEEKDLDNITIAELASEAGYSVGAFYARFNSKDQFFDALVGAHLARRSESLNQMYDKLDIEALVPELVKNIVSYYWKHRRFWRAAQMRNVRDPVFAKTFRKNFSDRSQKLIDRLERELGRPLSKAETADILFAFQVVMGTVNNAAFNESGPILLGQKLFVKEMQRSFLLVSNMETLYQEIRAAG